MSENRCKSCPLRNYDVKNVECASQKHSRYCELAAKSDRYHNKIVVESVRDHNEKVKREGMPLITWENAKQLGGELWKWAQSGEAVVPDEIYQIRMEICNNCECLVEGRCSICSCFVSKKSAIPSSSCPLKKWGEYSKRGDCGCSKG